MPDACKEILQLNNEIHTAFKTDNFSRLLFLDQKRRTMIKSLASDPNFFLTEDNLAIIRRTAEQNQNLVIEITKRMSGLTNTTNKKIKMLRSYHSNQ